MSLATGIRYNFASNILPFSQLELRLTSCMILIKEYISLATATMKIGKKTFLKQHRNDC